jgi:hypothetical protein
LNTIKNDLAIAPQFLTLHEEAANETTSSTRLQELARQSDLLAQIVAENHAAPAELLRELSSSGNKNIRSAVTSNPNTPVDLLLRLGAEFPEKLLENPVFDPLKLLEILARDRDEDVRCNLAKNLNTPVELLKSLARNNYRGVRH